MLASFAPAVRKHVPWDWEVIAQADQAGGHNIGPASDQLAADLWRQYRIRLMLQAAQSPDLNTLDLGLWRSLSSHVDNLGRGLRQNVDVVAETAQRGFETWANAGEDGQSQISRVFAKLESITSVVIASGGDNNHEAARQAGVQLGAAQDESGEEVDMGGSDEEEVESDED